MSDKLTNIFADPNFRSSQAPNFYPNKQYRNGEVGALVVFQAERGLDFACSKAGLERVVRSDQIKERFVVLAKRNGGAPVFVAAEQAQTVLNRLRAIPPRAGKWGAYWWLTTNFMPVETDDEEIF